MYKPVYFLALIFMLFSIQSFSQCGAIGMIGEFNGWADDLFLEQDSLNPELMNTSVTFDASNDNNLDGIVEMKFRQDSSWVINWGSVDFPEGTGAQNGPNIPVPYGDYYVTFNCVTGHYLFSLSCGEISMMGEFNDWTNDIVMTRDNDSSYIYRASVIFSQEHDLYPDGNIELKFRADGNWDKNWGGTGFPADIAVFNGPSIIVPYGYYAVSFNCMTLEYIFINTSSVDEKVKNSQIAILPNPFHQEVKIEYTILTSSQVSLVILNSTGQQITKLTNERQMPGVYQASWNAEGFPGGMYFYHLTMDEMVLSGKMLLQD